jgi:hypothetical protein
MIKLRQEGVPLFRRVVVPNNDQAIPDDVFAALEHTNNKVKRLTERGKRERESARVCVSVRLSRVSNNGHAVPDDVFTTLKHTKLWLLCLSICLCAHTHTLSLSRSPVTDCPFLCRLPGHQRRRGGRFPQNGAGALSAYRPPQAAEALQDVSRHKHTQ